MLMGVLLRGKSHQPVAARTTANPAVDREPEIRAGLPRYLGRLRPLRAAKHGRVAALWQFDNQRVAFSFADIVFAEACAQPAGFGPDNGIVFGVMIRRSPEYFNGITDSLPRTKI
jgi:hypothetical protein